MFDLDTFIEECAQAAREPEPWRVVEGLLAGALADRPAIADARSTV